MHTLMLKQAYTKDASPHILLTLYKSHDLASIKVDSLEFNILKFQPIIESPQFRPSI